MSVSPSQNRTNPSPVPGPSTVIETSEDTSSLKSSATRLVIGCTVEEPEIVMVPLRSWAVEPLAPPVLPVPPPSSSLLHAAATSANTATVARTSRPFLRFPIPTSLSCGHTIGGRYPARLNGLRRSDERGMNARSACERWMSCRASPLPTLSADGRRAGHAGGRGGGGRRRRPRVHPEGTGERAPLGPRAGSRTRTDAGPARGVRSKRAGRPTSRSLRWRRGSCCSGRTARRASPTRPSRGISGSGRPPADALLPLGLRHLTERAAGAQAVLAVEVEIGAPTRTLRGFAAPDGGRLGRAGDPRHHRDPALGAGAARLRGQRLARAEDAGGLDPGGRRDDPHGRRRGPLGDPTLRLPARTRGRAPVADRLGPARPLPARVRERAGGDGRARSDRPRRGRAVRGAGGRGGRRALDRGRRGAARPRLGAGPRVAGAEPGGQRDPLHGAGRQGARRAHERTTARSSSRSSTPASGSRAATSPGSSNASTGSTARDRARPAGPGSACRSSSTSPRTTADGSS